MINKSPIKLSFLWYVYTYYHTMYKNTVDIKDVGVKEVYTATSCISLYEKNRKVHNKSYIHGKNPEWGKTTLQTKWFEIIILLLQEIPKIFLNSIIINVIQNGKIFEAVRVKWPEI